MKILLMGDASNYHSALAAGLSALGHSVTVASDGSRWMDTARSVDLSRRPGKLGGAMLWARLSTVLRNRLRGYDVVHISNPVFLHLRPNRVRTLFERLRRDNGAVFLTALGTDTPYVSMCLANDNPLAYSEWRVGNVPTPFAVGPGGHDSAKWLEPLLADHSRYVYDVVDGVVSALYEYHLAASRVVEPARLAYGGIPIDTDSVRFVGAGNHDGPLRVFAPYHRGREDEKGTDILYDAVCRMDGVVVERVTGLRYADFVRRLEEADVVLDQLYSYTPATTALLAMAMGKLVVTGAEPDFEAFVGDRVPALNPDPRCPERLAADLTALLPDISRRAHETRDFVVRHNDKRVVARRFIDFWNTRL